MSTLVAGCSLILNPDPGGGPAPMGDPRYGLRCAVDNECGPGESCRANRCTTACSGSSPCAGDGIAECGASGFCEFLTPPPIEGTINVGYLYVGPVGDFGWTATHEEGRVYVQENLMDVATHYAPSVSTANAPAEIEKFLTEGADGMPGTGDEDDVVIATSFDFLAPMQQAALQNPDRNFLGCALFTNGPNLGSYFSRMEQVMWLGGRLAAQVTESNRIGIIGPVTIPETVRHINAFTLGVRSKNPQAKVIVRWTGEWFNPEEETQATMELVAAGVDVLYGQTDTRVPQEVLRDMNIRSIDIEETMGEDESGRPILTFGHDNQNACDGDPSCVASLGYNWGPMLVQILQDMRDGRWRPDISIWEQMRSDPAVSSVYLTQINRAHVPSAVQLDVESFIPMLAGSEGTYLAFRGPVRDNTGRLRIPEGDEPDDDALLRMCWFVDGVFDYEDVDQPAVVPDCVGDR
ncbi:MAG: BMP family ABC transporter substrate-binding protein [Deltaproteobacteria bacterium]|nr:BMP family ABC transporter substrate-binding protein [Deltaproteobacteria bacterium]